MPRAWLLLTCLPVLSGCSQACDNTLITRTMAPDGKHAAVLFNRDCGATTGVSTQISITDATTAPSGKGNAFIADDDHGRATSGTWGGPWATVTWTAPDHLLVRHAKNARIFLQARSIEGVTVSYQPMDRPAG